jgi:hypothetical protein
MIWMMGIATEDKGSSLFGCQGKESITGIMSALSKAQAVDFQWNL